MFKGKVSKFSLTKEKEERYLLSEESALEQVRQFCLKFDVDIDSAKDKKEYARIENLLETLLEFVRLGYIEIHDNYSITQHIQDPPGEVVQLNYKKITGEQKLAMDGKDENDRYEMLYACLGAACGLGDMAIRKLSGTDLKVAEALGLAFL